MSDIAVPAGKARAFAKSLLLSVILVALTWAVVVFWWRAVHWNATALDIVLGFGLLPCVPLAAMAFLRRRAMRAPSPTIPDPTQENLSVQLPPSKAQPAPALPILNAWAITHAAMNLDELVQVLVERRTQPRPDPELTDRDGFPVLSGRVAGLDTTHAEHWLAQTGVAADQVHPPVWRDAFVRVLALLGSLADQIESELHLLATAAEQSSATANDSEATLRGMSAPAPQAGQFRLLVRLMIPAAFLPHERQTMLDFVLQRFPLFQGLNARVELAPSHEDAAAIALLEQFRLDSAGGNAQALLLLACDSMLCPEVLEACQAGAHLFGTRSPNGLMAGEGAFGILCANDAALDILPTPAACLLAGTSHHVREHSADAPGRPSHACLAQAARDALAASGAVPERIGMVVCDTDHRSSRVLECIGAMAQHAPHLDAIQNRLAVSETCGHLGAATGPAVLAAGIRWTANASSPTILLNLCHAFDRAAAVLLPPTEA